MGQQTLGRGIEQLPPFEDPRTHRYMGLILEQMDAFDADSSMRLIADALLYIDPDKDREPLYYLLSYRAEVLYYEGLFNDAMQDLDRCMGIAEEMKDSMLIANVQNLRGLLHENIQDSKLALPFLRSALYYYPARPRARYPVTELHHIHGNMGSYLMQLDELDSSATHLTRSLELARRAGAHRGTAVALWSLGNLALRMNLPDSATHAFKEALGTATTSSDEDVALDALIGMAAAAAARGDHSQALDLVRQSDAYVKRHMDAIGLITQRNHAREISRILRRLNEPDAALDRLLDWHHIDSLITARNIHSALATQASLLRTDADLAMERIQLQRTADALERVRFSRLLVAISSLIGLSILLASYLVFRSRQRHLRRLAELEVLRLEQDRTIAELRIREQVSRDMHDDLGAGLSGLKLRSEMAIRMEQDPVKKAQLQALANMAGELMASMRQIIWALNVDQTSLEDLAVYVIRYARDYAAQNDLRIEVTPHAQWPELSVDSDQRRNIFLVVKEALHNVVKHAQATEIQLRLAWKNGLEVLIHDNGVGLPRSADETAGNGLRNMRKRIENLGGALDVLNGKGTTIRFQVPLESTPNQRSIGEAVRSTAPSRT
ncbi:MAG: tetratricopeptide repeat protein [Flavobacteriales bacterium]|nr:tetratricopeptide repeat protein [Flavobacteriales bacterium]